MKDYIKEIMNYITSSPFIIELGSGTGEKVSLLLSECQKGASYVAVDISKSFLLEATNFLAKSYSKVKMYAICADFTKLESLSFLKEKRPNKIFFFPGSTIGNFSEKEALILTKRVRSFMSSGDAFLVGFDLEKDRQILERAYNDKKGVTAKFNYNILKRINKELQGNFCLEFFKHQAIYNTKEKRIEMYLISLKEQNIQINNKIFHFRKGEKIHTENSHKYSTLRIKKLFEKAGFFLEKSWTDSEKYFSINYFLAC